MKEFVDFLGGQPPYDALEPGELSRLAAAVEVEYVTRGSVLVAQGAPVPGHRWVVRAGALELVDGDRVVDLLGEGDTVGDERVRDGVSARFTVRAADDSLCYRLPDPAAVLERPERLRYGGARPVAPGGRPRGGATGLGDRAGLPVTRYARPVVRCPADTPVREAARLIGASHQSCAVVTFPDGLGIVTDADFRRCVASGEVGVDAPVHRIASRPALTVTEDVVVAQAFARMLEHGVHHLVVVDDGGRPSGVVRVVDLTSAEVRDPLVVRAAVEAAPTPAALAVACRMLPATAVDLHDAGVPARRVGALLAAVVDRVLRRVLELTPGGTDPEAPPTAWLVLGSLARREVLPGSDVDTALVWDDSGWDAAEPDGAGGTAGERALVAASRALAGLRAVGLRTCPDGANADNPRFARSLADWCASTDRWLRDPNSTADALLLSTMLADSRPLTRPDLARQVTDGLLRAGRSPQFLRLLLQYSLSARPPTGFVRDFVVEHSGARRGQLDLKRGGLRPVTSLGRWIAVTTGDASGDTPARLRRGAHARLLTVDEADTLIAAHDQVFALLLEREVEALRAGSRADTYLAPDSLDSLTRRHLRESFRAIARVQHRLESIWTDRTGA